MKDCKFTNKLHRMIVNDKRYSIKELSDGLSLTYDAFYSRLAGRVYFRPDEITKIINITKNYELASIIMENTDFLVIPPSDKNLENFKKKSK